MDRSDLVCASSGVVAPYVASAPIAAPPRDRDAQVLCVPVLLRPGGFCWPFLFSRGRGRGNRYAWPFDHTGGSCCGRGRGRSERPVSDSLSVLLVDLSDEALQFLAPYDSEAGLTVVSFDPVHPDRFPSAEDLLVLARSWLRAAAHDRAAFYTGGGGKRKSLERLQVETLPWRPRPARSLQSRSGSLQVSLPTSCQPSWSSCRR